MSQPRSGHRWGLLATLAVAASALAQPEGRGINPGALGANALPTLPNEAPWVGDDVRVSLGWAGQLSTPVGGGVDGSMLLPFRLEVPIAGRVSLSADGSPFELFQYSPQTRAAWAPRRSKGITRADVSLATKVLLWKELGWRPAAALRATLKTATGEDLFTRRFLDAPAYQFDLLLGWHRVVGHTRLELWLNLGFLAWQQGAVGQNDAVALAGTLRARWPTVALRAELRGSAGWQRLDAPLTLATQVEFTVTETLELVLGAARTFQDPPSLDVRASVRLRWPTGAR